MARGYGAGNGDVPTAVGHVLELKHHVLNGRIVQAKRLIEASRLALEDCADEDGNTPLHWCTQGLEVDAEKREATDEEMLVFLLQHGAPRNRQNILGESPLFAAVRMASSGCTQRAERLVGEMLRKGQADPNRPDNTGMTPLMEACALSLEPVAQLLLEQRADPSATCSSGLSAVKLAEDERCALLLKSPLAERAAKEAQASRERGEGESERDEPAMIGAAKSQAKNFEQTLFGQKLKPGLAKDKDQPGKPYPEYGTLHDID
jgi:ankyrin repeat protein